jgi:hypothetical protein
LITYSHRIDYKYGETIQILPISDVHMGSEYCDEQGFKKWLDRHQGAYLLGNGDLMDMVITSDLKRYRKTSDGTEGDDIVDQQIGRMYQYLKPFKGRIIGLGTGNHEDSITKHCGTNPMKRLCEMLGCKFLGYTWLIKLLFSSDKGGRGRAVVIYGTHGWGGGSRTQGADLTKFSKHIGSWDADCFLFGHVHRKQSDRIPRLGLAADKALTLVAKPQLIGITGTWLKTLSATADPTYSELKGYPPVEIGGLVLNIKPLRTPGVEMWFDS